MAARLVSDALWSLFSPLLPSRPPRPKGGRPPLDDAARLLDQRDAIGIRQGRIQDHDMVVGARRRSACLCRTADGIHRVQLCRRPVMADCKLLVRTISESSSRVPVESWSTYCCELPKRPKLKCDWDGGALAYREKPRRSGRPGR